MAPQMKPAPDRSLLQRKDALVEANRIRTYRKGLKADLYAQRRDPRDVLLNYEAEVGSMKVYYLLLATPGMGHVKANTAMKRVGISMAKTIGGLSSRQRRELVGLLPRVRVQQTLERAA